MPLRHVPIRIVRDPPLHSVLVVHGAGFVGQALCRDLVSNPDFQVICLDRTLPDPVLCASDNFRFVDGDPTDRAQLAMLLVERRIDTIINLAGTVTHADGAAARRSLVATNVVGVQQLLDTALDYWRRLPGDHRARFRFLHLSAADVYGNAPFEGRRFDENAPYQPSTPYAASVAAADHLVRAWHQSFGLPTLIAGVGNFYGAGQSVERFIPRIITAAMTDAPIEILGTGARIRDWTHIDDLVSALAAIFSLGQPGETYLVGGRQEHSYLAVAAMICDIIDQIDPWPDGRKRRSLIRFVADVPGHAHRQAIDPSRTEHDLGWRAAVDIRAGLAETINWYRARLLSRPPAQLERCFNDS